MASSKVLLSLEASVATTMQSEWLRIAKGLMANLEPLIAAGNFSEAHYQADHMTMKGVVSDSRNRIDELATSALLFGAGNAADRIANTSFVKGTQELPYALTQACDQLSAMVEVNGGEFVRSALHELIREEELFAKASLMKADFTAADLAEGGALNPEQLQTTRKTLYVNRPLALTNELIQWAKDQGFPSSLPAEELHVTICYSKAPVDWDKFVGPSDDGGYDTVVASGGKREVKRFGDAIVLTFESVELQTRHQEFLDGGASFDFDSYKPHITISYDPDFDISGVEPFSGDLEFGLEIWQQIKENWADKLTEIRLKKAELSLADRLNEAVLGTGKMVVDVGANLTTTRLVTFGFLAEAQERQLTTYQINEELDDRTCPVCEYMHGKTFQVASEYSRVLSALATQDPRELKSSAPWPKQTKAGLQALNGMTEAELQAAGYGSPPFHPGCRGILAKVGTVEETIPLGKMKIPSVTVAQVRPKPEPVDLGPVTVVPATSVEVAYLRDKINSIQSQTLREKALTLLGNGDLKAVNQLLAEYERSRT